MSCHRKKSHDPSFSYPLSKPFFQTTRAGLFSSFLSACLLKGQALPVVNKGIGGSLQKTTQPKRIYLQAKRITWPNPHEGIKPSDTVDGRNPAPVDMVDIPLFTRFHTSQVVVWDFFHQLVKPDDLVEVV